MKERERLAKFLVSQVVQDAQKDSENAKFMASVFASSIERKAMEAAKALIRTTVAETAA